MKYGGFMRSILLALTVFIASFTLFAQSRVTEKKLTIDDCVTSFDGSKVESTKVGYQYWFVDKSFLDGRTLKMSVVAPHKATHPPHRHSEDEFFFVLEGTAEFYLDGKTKVVKPYTSFYCPRKSEHGIRNVGDTELKYLVIKKYEMK
jgi:mannose-6-phosphate isomerase-like protein (cupin superfamily)